MRASAAGYYANLMQMYQHLEIPLHPLRFLFVFAEALSNYQRPIAQTANGFPASKPKTPLPCDAKPDNVGNPLRRYFIHASNLHQTPPPWPGNRGVVAHLMETLYLIVCYLWFTAACAFVLPITAYPNGSDSESCESFAEYLNRICLPEQYISKYLLPLMSSVSTCTHSEILSFPASDVVNYKRLSHGQHHYAVCGGVNQVQAKLSEGLDDVRLGARVLQVSPDSASASGKVHVRWQSLSDASGEVSEETFDRVVLAVSPDVAGKIFTPLSTMMDKIPTVQVESSVLRPFTSVQEKSGGAFSVLDGCGEGIAGCMHHGEEAESPAQTITLKTKFSTKGSRTEAVHTMPSGVVVSTCPLEVSPSAEKQTLQSAKFTRTLRTVESRAVVERIMGRARREDSRNEEDDDNDSDFDDDWVSGDDNVWVTGAWCWDGMVLLEGCVVSAMQVAHDFGVTVPWRRTPCT